MVKSIKNIRIIYTMLAVLLLANCSYTRVPIISNAYDSASNIIRRINPINLYKSSTRNSKSYSYSANTVIVKKKDTVYGIARKYGVPIRDFIKINRLRPPYGLKIGQRLRLPPAPFHIVKKGDTLYSISRKYNVDLPSLIRTNKLRKPYTLALGQKLSLPGSIVSKPQTIKLAKSSAKAKSKWSKASSKPKKYSKSYSKVLLPTPQARSSSKFLLPLKGSIISKFGTIGKGRHNDGINIKASRGDKIRSAENGVVAYAGNEIKGFGNLLLIKHSGGWMTAYAHNHELKVKKGDKVKRGQIISTVGSTGSVTTPQLHFEIRKGKRARNPLKYI